MHECMIVIFRTTMSCENVYDLKVNELIDENVDLWINCENVEIPSPECFFYEAL